MSSNGFVTNNSVVKTTRFTKSEAFRHKKRFKINNLSITTERVLLTEAVDCDEEFIGETCNLPSGLTVGKDTSLKLHSHSK